MRFQRLSGASSWPSAQISGGFDSGTRLILCGVTQLMTGESERRAE